MAAPKESLEERLKALQEEYSKTKDNKATNKAVGLLRHKMAEIRKQIAAGGKGKGQGFYIKKTGDATVAMLGFPSVGKSSLINVLAGTKSKTAEYAFTTTTIIPGTMVQNDAHIQIFDMPGVIEGAHLGAGGGKAVIGAMRVADLVLFVLDASDAEWQLGTLLNELKALDIHINERKPNVKIVETETGGIDIELNQSGISEMYLKEMLAGLGMHNAKVRIDQRVGIDDLISLISDKAYYMRAIAALNKVDRLGGYDALAKRLSERYNMDVVPVSATEGINIDRLRSRIFDSLSIMTVYLKPRAETERMMPVVLWRSSKVLDAARKLHTELADELKCAYVTGPSSKFSRQRVGAQHVLKHGDIITFVKTR